MVFGPRSRWRSSRLSPYDEDLSIPPHIRHQRRLAVQRELDLELEHEPEPEHEQVSAVEASSVSGTSKSQAEGLEREGPGILETSRQSNHTDVDETGERVARSTAETVTESSSDSDHGGGSESPRHSLDEPSPTPSEQASPGSSGSSRKPQRLPAFSYDSKFVEQEKDNKGHTEEEWTITSSQAEDSPRSQRLNEEELARQEQQAAKLFPTRDCQVELYHIQAMTRKLVQVYSDGISVVDPHDFLQVLSWSNISVEVNQQFDLIRHLRLQLTRRGKARKQILFPFHWDGHILLGYIDRSRVPGHQVRLFSSDSAWVKVARTRPQRHNPNYLLMNFMETVFPEDPPIRGLPRIETTLQEQTPLDPRLFLTQHRACFVDGQNTTFKQTLPIFFQALHFVSGTQIPSLGRFKIEPIFLKRLIAVFSKTPFRNAQLFMLRREAEAKLRTDLVNDINGRYAMAPFAIGTALRGGIGIPGEIIQAKWIARLQLLDGVDCARDKALAFAEAYNHLAKLMRALCHRVRRKSTALRYDTIETVVLRSEECWKPLDENWTDATALTRWELEEINDLQARLDWMMAELGLFDAEHRLAIANIVQPDK